MGKAGITIKTMPTSPEVNLEEIKTKIQEVVESEEGKILEHNEEPVAFGLKAIVTRFQWDEQKESEEIVGKVESIENVNSCQVIDVRRMVQ